MPTTNLNGSPTTRLWVAPAVHALRRAQPPPTRSRTPSRPRRVFWGYVVLSAVLAALVPITAAVGLNVGNSPAYRLLIALAIPVLAGLAVTASAAASGAVPRARCRGGHRRRRRERRPAARTRESRQPLPSMGRLPAWARSVIVVGPAVPTVEPAVDATTTTRDIVDEWGLDSFPASDPPANW